MASVNTERTRPPCGLNPMITCSTEPEESQNNRLSLPIPTINIVTVEVEHPPISCQYNSLQQTTPKSLAREELQQWRGLTPGDSPSPCWSLPPSYSDVIFHDENECTSSKACHQCTETQGNFLTPTFIPSRLKKSTSEQSSLSRVAHFNVITEYDEKRQSTSTKVIEDDVITRQALIPTAPPISDTDDEVLSLSVSDVTLKERFCGCCRTPKAHHRGVILRRDVSMSLSSDLADGSCVCRAKHVCICVGLLVVLVLILSLYFVWKEQPQYFTTMRS